MKRGEVSGYKPYYDKLSVAAIGCGGQGAVDLNEAARTANIVALGDVDEVRAARSFQRFDKTPKYKDSRVMLVIAFRVPGKLEWDGRNLRFTNSQEANKYVKPVFRRGCEPKL
jgi:hypothetical protein